MVVTSHSILYLDNFMAIDISKPYVKGKLIYRDSPPTTRDDGSLLVNKSDYYPGDVWILNEPKSTRTYTRVNDSWESNMGLVRGDTFPSFGLPDDLFFHTGHSDYFRYFPDGYWHSNEIKTAEFNFTSTTSSLNAALTQHAPKFEDDVVIRIEEVRVVGSIASNQTLAEGYWGIRIYAEYDDDGRIYFFEVDTIGHDGSGANTNLHLVLPGSLASNLNQIIYPERGVDGAHITDIRALITKNGNAANWSVPGLFLKYRLVEKRMYLDVV